MSVKSKFLSFFILLACMTLPFAPVRSAWAACSSPAGVAGEVVYNTDHNILQFCNDTNWIGMGGGGAGVTDGDKGDLTVSGTGANWMIDDDVLDFTELSDAMTLDASTRITVTGSNVLTLTNTGTGNSLVVEDQASDTSPFVIAADGKVGIGTDTPTQALDIVGTVTPNSLLMKKVAGASAPTSAGGGGGGIATKTQTQRQAMTPTAGTVIYNSTFNRIEWYNGTSWYTAGIAVTAPDNLASCKDILNAGLSTGDGTYTIDPDGNGGSAAFSVYCDMTRDGGGWMLVIKSQSQDENSTLWSATTDLNLSACLSTTDANDNNCRNGGVYTISSWTTLRGENITGGYRAQIPKNVARTSLYNHFTGATLADNNMHPFMGALFNNLGSMGPSNYWNGAGASGRYGKMITDGAGYQMGIVGGHNTGGCGQTVTGNTDCTSTNKKVWLWIR